MLGRLADLLGELALGGLERLLALDVELAGGDLEQVRARRSPRAAGGRGRGRSSSWATTPTAPLWRTISRSASSPSSWRKVSSATVKILPS